jgi:hypothetical protein
MEKPKPIKISIAALLPIVAALLLCEYRVLPWTTISWIPGGNTVCVKGFGAMPDCDREYNRTAAMRWKVPKGRPTLYEDWYVPPKDEAASVTRLIISWGVTRIGSNTFMNTNLISAKIPGSVTSIGDGAFWNCNGLTDVTIPKNITYIGDEAFALTCLKSVTIPGSVAYIGNNAFIGNRSIKLDSNWNIVSEEWNNRLTSVTIENGVKIIGAGAFCNTRLTSVTIPGSVTVIGENAFNGCTDLTVVTIGNGVMTIEDQAFANTGLTSIVSLNPVPPAIGRDAFGRIPSNACLYVPVGGIDAYRSADVWKNIECVKDLASAPKTPGRTKKSATRNGH